MSLDERPLTAVLVPPSAVRSLQPVEMEWHAPDSAPLELWIEPWGDRIEIAAGKSVMLRLDGDVVEPLSVDSRNDAVTICVPRNAVLHVAGDDGEVSREYDTADLPPLP